MAAGSAVFYANESPDGQVLELTWVCTADGSGDVSAPTITQGGNLSHKYDNPFTGIIGQVRIKPGTGGDQPSDNYDVELRPTNDSTIDFLGGLGDNCSQTNTRVDTPLSETNGIAMSLFNDILQPYAANCGAANKFTLTVYVWL